MDLYTENILDHYRDPRAKTRLANPSVSHHEENLSCGDELTIDLKINDGKVTDVGWEGEGCAISQAAMSMFSEELEGKDLREIANIKPEHIYEMLGVPIGPRRFKCALLCLHTLKNTLRVHEKEEPQHWVQTVAVTDEG